MSKAETVAKSGTNSGTNSATNVVKGETFRSKGRTNSKSLDWKITITKAETITVVKGGTFRGKEWD